MAALELALDYPGCLAADFPRELPVAVRAVDRVLAAIASCGSFGPLEDRSPGLRGNDWSNYLRCSEARMVHAANVLQRKGVTGGRLLDYGAYFGNFSLMFREMGFDVGRRVRHVHAFPLSDPRAASAVRRSHARLRRHGT